MAFRPLLLLCVIVWPGPLGGRLGLGRGLRFFSPLSALLRLGFVRLLGLGRTFMSGFVFFLRPCLPFVVLLALVDPIGVLFLLPLRLGRSFLLLLLLLFGTSRRACCSWSSPRLSGFAFFLRLALLSWRCSFWLGPIGVLFSSPVGPGPQLLSPSAALVVVRRAAPALGSHFPGAPLDRSRGLAPARPALRVVRGSLLGRACAS